MSRTIVKPSTNINLATPRVVSFRPATTPHWGSKFIQQFNTGLSFNAVFINSWQELSDSLATPTDLLLLHVSLFTRADLPAAKIIDMISTIADLSVCPLPLRIGVVIEKSTPKHLINTLRKSKVSGIIPDCVMWSLETGCNAVTSLLAGDYWPQDIIDELPGKDIKPILVYFRKNWAELLTKEITTHLDEGTPWKVVYAADWLELSNVLKEDPAYFMAHISMIAQNGTTITEFVTMVETLLKLTMPEKKMNVAISIDRDTPLAVVKELQRSGIFSLALSPVSWGIDEAHKAADALVNNIPYWPKYILDQLPGAVKPAIKNSIALTTRQSQIADLITGRGLSNKKIAQVLNITESTVKIHVSAILKSYGVRTRTQLAVVANS